MAKCIYVCKRYSEQSHVEEKNISDICNAIQPDNLEKANHKVFSDGKSSFGIMNFVPSIQIKNQSVLLGFMYEERENWEEIGSDFPDGSYAIFRNSESSFEAVSDILATRTIWYYHDEKQFIASTSQRAIVMYLGSFEFDNRVIPWMLSTGTIGPDFSWDKRIKKLTPDSSVQLDKQIWSVSTTEISFDFDIQNRSWKNHQKKLYEALDDTISSLTKLNLNHWPLTLSGGYDSRAILCFLNKFTDRSKEIRTITHGLRESRNNKKSDAYIADQLTSEIKTRHKFYSTNRSEEPAETIVDRFLQTSEGRIDHISAYMDGMKMWREYVEQEDIHGIIRGDVVFHPFKVPTERFVRHRLGFALCSDFKNLEQIPEIFGFPDQEIPDRLKIKPNESPYDWRDRLYQGYRVPTIHGALSEIKLSYVEMTSPLLSKKIVKTVREFPEKLRRNKNIFKKIIDSLSPKIPYAGEESTVSKEAALRESDIVILMKEKLRSKLSRDLLGHKFINYVLENIKSNTDQAHKESLLLKLKKKFRSLVYENFPEIIMYYYEKRRSNPSLDNNTLAFRLFMIVRMIEILQKDSSMIHSESIITTDNFKK